jgi:hypothetical protein
MDFLFASRRDIDTQSVFDYLDELMISIGTAVEAQNYIYAWFNGLKG